MAALKEVLVSIGENNREVQFSGSRDQLLAAIEISFVDILGNGGLRDSAHIQMWKQKWGCFVDLKLGQEIPDGCQLKVINVVKQTATTSVNGMQATTSVDGKQETPPALKIAKLSEIKQVPYCTTLVSEEPQNGTSQLKEVQKACGQPTKFWSGRVKLFVYFINPDILKGWKCGDGQMNLETILAWAEKWNDASAGDIPKFERTKVLQDADIRVQFVEVGDCWSKVGTDAESVVSPKPTMHLALKGQQSDFQKYLVIHEFGHSLGLEHEHQRYDFWEVATKVIDLDKMKADSRMVNTDFERDILEHKDSSKFKTSLYDSESVMHYWFDVNWLKHDRHKTEEGVDGDKLLTPEERVILEGIHRRNNSFVDRPSKKDMDFLKGYYAKKQGERRAKTPSGPSNSPAASGFSVTATTPNTTETVLTRNNFENLSDEKVLELVDDVIVLDEDDFSDVLGYLSEDAGQWQAISRNLHVKGGKITELIHSGQPAPTCLANAITDWLRLNYNHQRFGKPTWKKVAESVVKPTLINKRLFIRIAAEHTVKGVTVVPDSEQLTQTPTAQGGPAQPAGVTVVPNSEQLTQTPTAQGGPTQPAGTYRVLTINDNLIHVKTAVWKGREQWKEIGILLPGVEQDTINSVQGTNNGERLNEVLSKWIHTGKARINHLLTALRHTTVGRGDIADNICGLKGEERARVGLDL